MTDRFEDLRTFLAIVQAQGFNHAAERLGLAKSAVSRRMRDLENRLGTQLIHRNTRKIGLTEAGASFYERGVKLLADLQEVEAVASTGAHEPTGRLRMTAPMSFTTDILSPLLNEFSQRHPRLRIDVEADDRKLDIVSAGFDLALQIGRLKDSSLISRRIATIRHLCFASPAYLKAHGRPKTPSDLRAHRGIVYSNVDSRDYWTFANAVSVEAPSALSFNNGDAIREAAIAGGGIAMMPSFIVYRAIERGDLEVILAKFMRTPIALYALHPSSKNVPAKIRLLIDFLVEKFSNEPSWDRHLPKGGGK